MISFVGNLNLVLAGGLFDVSLVIVSGQQIVHLTEQLAPCRYAVIFVLGREVSSDGKIWIPSVHIEIAGHIVVLQLRESCIVRLNYLKIYLFDAREHLSSLLHPILQEQVVGERQDMLVVGNMAAQEQRYQELRVSFLELSVEDCALFLVHEFVGSVGAQREVLEDLLVLEGISFFLFADRLNNSPDVLVIEGELPNHIIVVVALSVDAQQLLVIGTIFEQPVDLALVEVLIVEDVLFADELQNVLFSTRSQDIVEGLQLNLTWPIADWQRLRLISSSHDS